MKIDPYQVPLVIMSGIFLLTYFWALFHLTLNSVGSHLQKNVLPWIFGLLIATIATIVLGPGLADQIASILIAVATFVVLHERYRRIGPPDVPAVDSDTRRPETGGD
ncbi:MAG TPA: hypothetical protein VFZ32_07165 [Micromonosporaceae bacterium]